MDFKEFLIVVFVVLLGDLNGADAKIEQHAVPHKISKRFESEFDELFESYMQARGADDDDLRLIQTRNLDMEKRSFGNDIIDDLFAELKVQRRGEFYKRQTVDTTVPTGVKVCTGGFSTDSSGKAWCNSDASGVKRAAYEVDCVFPFLYKGVWYNQCTKADNTNFWCSLDSTFQNRFAYCQQACSLKARNLVASSGGTHTSCLAKSSSLVTSLFPSATAQQQIVDLHNAARSAVSPAATNMRAVAWDNDLARMAQIKAETCVMNHECSNCRKVLSNPTANIGQNIYTTSLTSTISESDLWKNTVTAWKNEVTNWVYNSKADLNLVGHYTQIINANVARIGCGAAKCSNGHFTYCNYAFGQLSTELLVPYTSGTSCSKCASGSCVNGLCQCTKYCRNGGTLNPTTCTCTCPGYASGTECEKLTCGGNDKTYKCFTTDATKCSASNIPAICPFLCKICILN